MEVILDKGFILVCMRKKIDFISQLKEKGFTIRVPREVLQELKDLQYESSLSHQDREIIKEIPMLFERLLEKNEIKHITFGKGKIEHWFIKKAHEGYYIATTNADIKHHIPRKIVILKSNRLGIEPMF